MTTTTPNRWIIAAAGVIMQVALGAVYAWSVFRVPLTRDYNRTVSEVTVAFELAILVLGFAAFLGGLWMRRVGHGGWRFSPRFSTDWELSWRDFRITWPCCISATE